MEPSPKYKVLGANQGPLSKSKNFGQNFDIDREIDEYAASSLMLDRRDSIDAEESI